MPSNTTTSVDDTLISFLGEVPNMPAAIVALCCYAVITIAVLIVTIKTRGWFMITAVITGLLETLGFIARVVLIRTANRNSLIMMQSLLIISPVLLAIVEYVCVGKLISRSEAGRATRWLRWQVYGFTASDFISLCVQGAGGAMLAQGDTNADAADMGRVLILAGLAIQLIFFGSFLFVTICIHVVPRFGYTGNKRYARVFHCLYVTIVLLYIRNIFRVVEFAQGWRGYLATHEVYFYIFDFIPVYFTFVYFTYWHYGLWLGPATLESVPPCEPKQATPFAAGFGRSDPSSTTVSTANLMEKGKVVPGVLDQQPYVARGSYRPASGGGAAGALGTPVLASASGVQMVHVSPRQTGAMQ